MSLKAKAMDLLASIASKNAKGRRYDDAGRYYPDPTPIAPPIGYIKSPSIAEQLRAMVRSEHVRQAAEQAGEDTFEEADDFEIGDDYDPRSPWEEQFDGEFSLPINQQPVARDPDDRNPPTPPVPGPNAPAAPGGGPGALPLAPEVPTPGVSQGTPKA